MHVNMMSMCMLWFVCMHMRSMFLVKHGFQSCVVHCTLAQSGAQIIYTLLQCTIIITMEEEVEQATCLSQKDEAMDV